MDKSHHPSFHCKHRPGDEVKRASLVVKVIMKQLFVALKRLHGMGIVHRDIKPVRGSSGPDLQHAAMNLLACPLEIAFVL